MASAARWQPRSRELAFATLDAPVTRLGAIDTPVPFARQLEAVHSPKDRLVPALRGLLASNRQTGDDCWTCRPLTVPSWGLEGAGLLRPRSRATRMARPCSSSSSVMVSGGMRRSTFSPGPHSEHDEAVVEAAGLDGLGGLLVGSSTPIMRPRPRTSTGPRRRTARRSTAPPAEAAGPLVAALVVEDVEGGQGRGARHRVAAEGRAVGAGRPALHAAWRGAMIPPSGRPEATPLAKRTTSGVTPNVSAAKGVAGAADAGLHLVEDQQDAVVVAALAAAPPASSTGGTT